MDRVVKHAQLPLDVVRARMRKFVKEDTPPDFGSIHEHRLSVRYVRDDGLSIIPGTDECMCTLVRYGPRHSVFMPGVFVRMLDPDYFGDTNPLDAERFEQMLDKAVPHWIVLGVMAERIKLEKEVEYDARNARACIAATAAFKQELMARAWHPSRLAQCLDTQEAAALNL